MGHRRIARSIPALEGLVVASLVGATPAKTGAQPPAWSSPPAPRGRPVPASSGLRRDPTLDLVASTHLAEVDAHPPAASYARVSRLIGRYGDSLSRLRPFAALGADFSARRRALAPVLARSTRAFGFTHVGWAETRDALVVVFGRRAAEIGPPRVRAEGVTLTVRAPDDAPIEAFL